jgi:hypothetical protein
MIHLAALLVSAVIILAVVVLILAPIIAIGCCIVGCTLYHCLLAGQAVWNAFLWMVMWLIGMTWKLILWAHERKKSRCA